MTTATAAPLMCIACGAAPRRAFRLKNAAWLKQCPRCRLHWWDWPPFDPDAYYDRDYFQGAAEVKGYDDYAALEAGLAKTARGRLARIARLLKGPAASTAALSGPRPQERGPGPPLACRVRVMPRPAGGPPPRLLELGCGTGVFLEAARQEGWEVRGVEVSAYAAEQARQRGLAVDTGLAEDLRPAAASYDCVTLWDVIEHVRDPAGVLRAAGRALRPGGVLALSTGDVTSLWATLSGPCWHLFNLPEHLYFFSPAAVRLLMSQAGCRVVHVTREVNWVPVAYLLERLRKTSGWLGRRAHGRFGGAAMRHISSWVVPATLFDVLGIYARRL